MKLFDALFKRKKPARRKAGRRGFSAAKTDRFFQNWTVTNQSADAELYIALRTLRARSRDLSINDDYVARFLKMIKTNIVGPRGFGFQNRARDNSGQLDTVANQLIEDGFKDWGRVGNCTVDGRMSWLDACNLYIESVARDGECLVRMHRQPNVNRYGFALEFIDADLLDETFNDQMAKGGPVRLSIQYDPFGRPTGYHLLNQHPNALVSDYKPIKREVVPAAEIIHGFVPHRAAQGRGYPWTAQSLKRLKMLAGYEMYELIASRLGASKMGFYTEPEGDDYTGDDLDEWDPITEAEAGTFDRLPAGVEFKPYDPEHPVAAYESFVLAILRGASAGLGVSYVSLANDLRGVSYSSIRQGALDERDYFRTLQTWMVEHFVDVVFRNWLQMSLTTQAIALPLGKFSKFNAPVWRPRGWSWIDPLKEVNANIKAIENRLRSLQSVVGEAGVDIEDILIDNTIAQELAAKHKTKLPILETEESQ